MTRLKLPRLDPTPESHYVRRRDFLKAMGYGGLISSVIAPIGCGAPQQARADLHLALLPGIERPGVLENFPAPRNQRYDLNVPCTNEVVAATHNNFYEFLPGRAGELWQLTEQFETDPWTIEVTGQCRKPRKFDIDDIFKLRGAGVDLEERTYRFRCVEAWAMDVPWTGLELGKFLKQVEPLNDARFVRFITANRPHQMPGMRQTLHQYPWPYFEGLRMDEAMNELTLLATGIYGRPLPRAHGAPFRIVVPWKYGYKSAKSIVRIELVASQPKTFWETLQPHEYPFESNVDPNVPHPRWSQASERVIGTRDRRRTSIYNGYGEFVAHLYA